MGARGLGGVETFDTQAVNGRDLKRFKIREGHAHRLGEEEIGQLRVSGQCRSVHIGGDDAALDGAFVGALGGAIGKVGGGGLVCIAIATRERAEGCLLYTSPSPRDRG